jgi:hypothetical protein
VNFILAGSSTALLNNETQIHIKETLHMKEKKVCVAALCVLALAIALPAANAVTVKVQGVGSSGVYQSIGVAAFNDLAGAGAHIWTKSGSCPSGGICAAIHDSRSGSIKDESGTVWVIWDATASNVWTYVTVDTIVGNRAYFATPRAQLVLDNCATAGGCPGAQKIPAALIGGTTDDATIPLAVFNAINNVAFTALITELRPEDAAQEQKRVVGTLNTLNLGGLGYGTGANTLVGTQILSAFTAAAANPVAFNIKGTDPFTKKPVPAFSQQNLGAYPVIWVANRKNAAGLGLKSGPNFVYTNLSDAHNAVASKSYLLQKLYGGADATNGCGTFFINSAFPNVPITLVLREPLSGTMTTAEFDEYRNAGNTTNSQEKGVGQPTTGTSANPLNKACSPSAVGTKIRAIGTGEETKGNGSGTGGILNITDSLGYFFWSFGNGSPFKSNPAQYGYFTLDGVDPLNMTYVDGTVPACTAPCPAPINTSFPHLRDGTYRAWTIVRVIDAAGGDANVDALVTKAQDDVNSIEPDFVSWNAIPDGDNGMTHYRSHFTTDGIAGKNLVEPPPGDGSAEAGGDVGGKIFARPEANDAAHLNKKQ